MRGTLSKLWTAIPIAVVVLIAVIPGTSRGFAESFHGNDPISATQANVASVGRTESACQAFALPRTATLRHMTVRKARLLRAPCAPVASAVLSPRLLLPRMKGVPGPNSADRSPDDLLALFNRLRL